MNASAGIDQKMCLRQGFWISQLNDPFDWFTPIVSILSSAGLRQDVAGLLPSIYVAGTSKF